MTSWIRSRTPFMSCRHSRNISGSSNREEPATGIIVVTVDGNSTSRAFVPVSSQISLASCRNAYALHAMRQHLERDEARRRAARRGLAVPPLANPVRPARPDPSRQ